MLRCVVWSLFAPLMVNFLDGEEMNEVEKGFKDANGDFKGFAKFYVNRLTTLLEGLNIDSLDRFCSDILEARENGKKIIFMGNGGSAATASHFANDIGIGTREYDKPFKALSVTDNNAVITAIANDGYENIFLYQLKLYLEPGDIVIPISASGNSKNLLLACEYAKKQGNKVFSLVGFDGGELLKMSDDSIHIDTTKGEYGPVEDLHMFCDHLVGNYLYQLMRMQK